MATEPISYRPISLPTPKPPAKKSENTGKTQETKAKTTQKSAANATSFLGTLTMIGALVGGGIGLASMFKSMNNANNYSYSSPFNFNMVGNFGPTPYQWNPQPLIWPILGNAAPGTSAMGGGFGQTAQAIPTWNAQAALSGFRGNIFPFGG